MKCRNIMWKTAHPAIIEPEVFDMVQAEIRRRGQSGRRYYTPHCFSGRIFCDECGKRLWKQGVAPAYGVAMQFPQQGA